MKIMTLPGVFAPRSDSWLLAEMIAREPVAGKTVLDLCCGSGVIGVSAARAGATATLVDVSARAAFTAWLNARRNGTRVRALRGSLFGAVGDERFDFVVSNPPYLPSPDGGIPSRGARRAWDAGRDGRELLDRICTEAPEHLRGEGSILLVQSSLIGEDRTLELLAAGGLKAEVAERRRGPLGPLMAERAALMHERGLLDEIPDSEDIVVIRGSAPAGR